MSAVSPAAKATPSPTPFKPIDVLQDQPAQLYANFHPVLLLSILLASFKTLVQDPVNTLLGLAPIVAVLQAIYCATCLPRFGQNVTATSKPGQKRKTTKPAQEVWARIVV